MATKLTAKKHAPASSNPKSNAPALPARHHSEFSLDDELSVVTNKLHDLRKSHALLAREAERLALALREQQERLRAIMGTAADAILTVDDKGFIESINAAAERMFGYTSAELRGQNVKVLMPLTNMEEEQDSLVSRYGANGQKNLSASGHEAEGRRRDGTTFPLQLAIGEVAGMNLFTAILRDISLRKRLEREIVEIALVEQRRLGQDLHDNCGQELTALGLLADGLVESLSKSAPADVGVASKIEQALKRVLRQVRNISRGLVQVDVDPAGLPGALADLASRLSATS